MRHAQKCHRRCAHILLGHTKLKEFTKKVSTHTGPTVASQDAVDFPGQKPDFM